MKRPKRNDPCWCNSGKKYKKCHLRSDESGETAPPDTAGGQGRKPTVTAGKISPLLQVPGEIAVPEYAGTGTPGGRGRSCRKESEGEISGMRHAGQIAREVLDTVLAAVEPGITTNALDEIAHHAATSRGAYPSPLNYMGFPKSLCTSVNEVVVHGIPDSRKLLEGDIVNCDVTIYIDGMHGDCSETVPVGRVSREALSLVQVTWECLLMGIDVVRPGQLFSEIGRVIENHAVKHGYSVVREFTGHGIGGTFHMTPYVAHFYEPANKALIEEGMTFTIEPMINSGSPGCRIWPDNWTAVTEDLALSAQFEHTLLVTETGAEILTGGRNPWFLKG
ncbi:MAG: type I methionyl aminopeptidase [Deltaproteobacteria bacterium]|nr:type I methionyl aminopeptidase [Deltaproteobacteria bacterium]